MLYCNRYDWYFRHCPSTQAQTHTTYHKTNQYLIHCEFLDSNYPEQVQLNANWWIVQFCCYSEITTSHVKARLLNTWITNTNLDKQGTWASFSRWFWHMCIQATWGCHCVQTEDVGGILRKNKHQEDCHSKVQGIVCPVHVMWSLGTAHILNLRTRFRYVGTITHALATLSLWNEPVVCTFGLILKTFNIWI